LVQNSKKAEEVFKLTVDANKQYFEHISEFGEQIKEKIDVKYPELNSKFVTDVELDKSVVDQVITEHLSREGLHQCARLFNNEDMISQSLSF
jgi:hypothetical protein